MVAYIVLAVLWTIAGVLAFISSKSAFHEIEGIGCFIVSALNVIAYEIARTRKKLR